MGECRLDIGDGLALGDECRASIEHGVEDRAGVVVAVVAIGEQGSIEVVKSGRRHQVLQSGVIGTYRPRAATSRIVRRG
jgi:hypothetical protein